MKMKQTLITIFLLSGTAYAEETQSQHWKGKHGSEVHLETTKGMTDGSYHLEATGPQGTTIESQGNAHLTKDGVKIETETQNAQGQTGGFNGMLKKDGDNYHLSGDHKSLKGEDHKIDHKWKEGEMKQKIEGQKSKWQQKKSSFRKSGAPSERRPSSFSRQRQAPKRVPMARPSGPSRRGRR